MARFLFTVCQTGAEPALKSELGRNHPERHIRIAYTQTVARLEEAVARIRKLLDRRP